MSKIDGPGQDTKGGRHGAFKKHSIVNTMKTREILCNHIIGVILVLFVFLLDASLAQEMIYGAEVKKAVLVDCFGKEIVFPNKDTITLIYFFNVSMPSHLNMLNELNFLSNNLDISNDIVRIVAISKTTEKELQSLSKKYKLDNFVFIRINKSLEKQYGIDCMSCNKVIIIDKSMKVRYLSSNFDLTFMREIIQRLVGEE